MRTSTTATSLDETDAIDTGSESLAEVLAHATFLTAARLTKVAADSDVSLTGLRLLGILRDRQVRMSVLADYMGLDRSSMTGLVDRAEKKGLVVRTTNVEDGRAVDVQLTDAGKRFGATLQAEAARAMADLTGKLTQPEQRRLRALLERVIRD